MSENQPHRGPGRPKKEPIQTLPVEPLESVPVSEPVSKTPIAAVGNGRVLPRRFHQVKARKPDFLPKPLEKISPDSAVREYALSPIVSASRGTRNWQPYEFEEAKEMLEAQGRFDTLSRLKASPEGYAMFNDTIQGWMPEEHANEREKRLAEKSKTFGAKEFQRARQSLKDKAKEISGGGISVELEVEEEPEEVSHFRRMEDMKGAGIS